MFHLLHINFLVFKGKTNYKQINLVSQSHRLISEDGQPLTIKTFGLNENKRVDLLAF